MRRTALATLLAAALLAACGCAAAGAPGHDPDVPRALAPTPPMGWNGFNRFSRSVTAAIVEREARTIVSSGMRAAGYRYVNLDGGWDLLQRDGAGELQPNPALFPDGIKPVADYVHSLGLKFGIYTAAGTTNCAKTSAASFGHYAQDAKTFASWGVDYVKFDWCFLPPLSDYPGLTHGQLSEQLTSEMADAIAASGRPMVLDVNDVWDKDDTSTWAGKYGSLWRVAHDIRDNWPSLLDNFTRDVVLAGAAHPGGWNDPDVLEVGNGGMTQTEDRTEFSLWAELAAPLLAGNDLSTMSPATRAILTNRAVVAVDQDRLGRQGVAVASAGGHWVLTKPLSGGDRSVVLFNATDAPARIATTAARAGLRAAPSYRLRDLWTGKATTTRSAISALVPAHAVTMVRVTALR